MAREAGTRNYGRQGLLLRQAQDEVFRMGCFFNDLILSLSKEEPATMRRPLSRARLGLFRS